jgi:hypothetical protein
MCLNELIFAASAHIIVMEGESVVYELIRKEDSHTTTTRPCTRNVFERIGVSRKQNLKTFLHLRCS